MLQNHFESFKTEHESFITEYIKFYGERVFIMVKISYDIPRDMVEAAQTAEILDKPFKLCFYCPSHTVTCGGTNDSLLPAEDVVDKLIELAKQQHKTHEDVAIGAKLSPATVTSVLSKRTKDPRHSTLHAISQAVNGNCLNGAPCYMAYQLMTGQITMESLDVDEEQLAKRVSELETLLKESEETVLKLETIMASIHDSYKEEMAEIRAKAERIAEFLKEEITKRDEQLALKDKLIAKLILDK